MVDKTVMRYLKKRIDTKMDKELSSKQPPFDELVADVVRLSPTEPEPEPTAYCLFPATRRARWRAVAAPRAPSR